MKQAVSFVALRSDRAQVPAASLERRLQVLRGLRAHVTGKVALAAPFPAGRTGPLEVRYLVGCGRWRAAVIDQMQSVAACCLRSPERQFGSQQKTFARTQTSIHFFLEWSPDRSQSTKSLICTGLSASSGTNAK